MWINDHMRTPLVSIIVPAYNAENAIERTITSLTNQTLQELEIIVINDASTDQTITILRDLAKKDERIQIIDLKENSGAHKARMAGLLQAQGEWIGFVDADDWVKPNMFKTMVNNALQTDADIVLCSVKRVNKNGRTLGYEPKFRSNTVLSSNIFEDFTDFKFNSGYLCNKLYKQSIIIPVTTIQFPWRQTLNEDVILNLGCFLRAKRVSIVKQAFYNYTKNPDGVTGQGTATAGFIEHLKAFAIAISTYGQEGPAVQERIINLYRMQLGFSALHIENPSDLVPFAQDIYNIEELLAKDYPLAFPMLIARALHPVTMGKRVFIVLVRRFLSKFIFRDGIYQYLR